MIDKHDKYYSFEGNVNGENIDKLVKFINENQGCILIGINSAGGSSKDGFFVTQILNEQKDRISLCVINGIYSTAFEMFYKFKGQKFITHGSKGMYHWGSRPIHTNDAGKPNYAEDVCFLETLKSEKEHTLRVATEFMTAKEINKLKRNKDVYFSFDRMKEIFPDAKII